MIYYANNFHYHFKKQFFSATRKTRNIGFPGIFNRLKKSQKNKKRKKTQHTTHNTHNTVTSADVNHRHAFWHLAKQKP